MREEEPRTSPGGELPAATVVVPAYNVERFITASIRSALDQTLASVEVIVIDDGSRDGTVAAVEAIGDPRVRIVRQANRGVSAARNAGLALARGPLVLFLDGDDLLAPDALERMSAALAARPGCVAAVAQHEKILEDGRSLSASLPPRALPACDTLRHLLASNFIVNGGALGIVTAHARAIGGYDETLAFGEDWEFWCRLAVRGDFAALPDLVSVRYRLRSLGANNQLRGTPLRPNFSAIDAVQRIPGIGARLTERERRRARRLAECETFWSAARNEIAGGNLLRIGQYLVLGILRYPQIVLQPGRMQRFISTSLRMASSR
ncbi:glycosyltransferase family 2 protein [Salinarimonas soli]|nr:glycosyltransferase family 2 protein [Salinarimonas soli]